MSSLFEPTTLAGIPLRNRFVRSATWMRMADERGVPDKRETQVLEQLAVGGVGLIITGYAFVMRDEQPNPGMLGIYDDSLVPVYAPIVQRVHQAGGRIALQIAYGGANTDFQPKDRVIWGPSAVRHPRSGVRPTPMTAEHITQLVDAFAQATRRAKLAGFDAVQLHGAHGYLLSQFLSPFYNRRTDNYGGNVENRARIIGDIAAACHAVAGASYPVLIKINCDDFDGHGMSFEECRQVCRLLVKWGIGGIEVSGGNAMGARREKVDPASGSWLGQEGYFAAYAGKLAEELSVPVISVGGHRTLADMQDLLGRSKVSFVAMSRPFIREPDLVRRFESGLSTRAACISCGKCWNERGNRCIFVPQEPDIG